MKKIFSIVCIILAVGVGIFAFDLFGFPDLPASTSSELKPLVTEELKNSYAVSSISSVTRISTFEGVHRPMKWLILNLDHQPIIDNKEIWTIAEKVCKVILKFGYEGVDILPKNFNPHGTSGASC